MTAVSAPPLPASADTSPTNHNGAKLRTCMLAACPFPANHGTPGSIREMAEALSDGGHDVHIVTYHFGEKVDVRGPKIHRIANWTNESQVRVGPTRYRPLYDLQMVFKTLQVIRKERPDVLHAHGYEAGLAAWLCRLVTGIPVVFSWHCTMGDELPTYNSMPKWLAVGLARMLDATVPRLGDRCIPHSANIEKFLHGMGLKGRTTPIIYKGIKLDNPVESDPAEIRNRYGLGDSPVVLYAGIMDRFQRLDLLMEAMKHVAQSIPDAKLLLVQTIHHERHLARVREEIAAAGISDRVAITEPLELDGVRQCIPTCDVAVVPRPQSPGFPIKILNYLAAKRGIVLFRSSSGGLEHSEHAWLAEPDSAEALGDGIVHLLRDPALRERLGHNGFDYIREHRDRKVTAGKIADVYHEAIALKRRSR